MSILVLTTIFGGIIMIVTWFSPCMAIAVKWWRIMGLLLLLTCLFEGLGFLLLASDVCTADYKGSTGWISTPTCSLSRGGNMAIAATVFWFIAAVSMFKIPPPENQAEEVVVQTTTTTTETTKPDGTKVVETKTEEVTLNP
mmetsp:Transcript_57864/g.172738  ORF Transcript_57864/g.172738 Transcript_57864/m.172738 type:complete len:141 (-) Transcript_57864:141-563(-)